MSQLPNPCHFADAVHACPLRLVLSDDLTRCTTTLAYAEGDRLSGCLDLVRAPSERLWVEWAETPRQEALGDILGEPITPEVAGGRAGVLVSADTAGRTGTMRTFWSTPDGRVGCAALIAEFDLNRPIRAPNSVAEIFNGASAGVTLSQDSVIDSLFGHIAFRFDSAWVEYYRSENLSSDQQSSVLCTALGSTAFSVPSLFALFLLLAAKDAARRRLVNLDRLNSRRRLSGKTELLEHIEVSASIRARYDDARAAVDSNTRIGRRLHRVRGHLARRGDNIFWRSPHLRGNASLGAVRSRTVKLTFH